MLIQKIKESIMHQDTLAFSLLIKEVDIDATRTELNDRTLLQYASRHGLLLEMEILLGQGADVNATDTWGFTALHEACLTEQLDSASFLLNNGADVNYAGKDMLTALHVACLYHQTECVQLLLEHGASEYSNGQSVRSLSLPSDIQEMLSKKF